MEEKDRLEERMKMLEELFKDKDYKPMKFKDIVGLLQVPRAAKNDLKNVLDQMISRGSIILDNQGKYRAPSDNMKVGTFSGTQRGFGFGNKQQW